MGGGGGMPPHDLPQPEGICDSETSRVGERVFRSFGLYSFNIYIFILKVGFKSLFPSHSREEHACRQ